jgi:hypothetical protein
MSVPKNPSTTLLQSASQVTVATGETTSTSSGLKVWTRDVTEAPGAGMGRLPHNHGDIMEISWGFIWNYDMIRKLWIGFMI